jgi:hypothetical protein
MSILDDAIREHLELKRAHGADEGVLKKLEDDAFGPPQRPDEIDPFAEAPTEFLTSPGEDAADIPAIFDEEERGGRRPNIADLQEAPPTGDAVTEAPVPEDAPPPSFEDAAPQSLTPFQDELAPPPADAPPPSPADAADVPLPPPPGEAAADLAPPPDLAAPIEESQQPVAEEPPSAEAPPAPDLGPSTEEPLAGEASIAPEAGPGTEERHAIAEQPTQMFDVQAHVDAEAAAVAPEVPAEQTSLDAEPPFADQPTPTDETSVEQSSLTDEAPIEQASPSDEELVDAAQAEPHAAPPAPEEPGTPAPAPVDLGSQEPLETRGPDAEVAGHPPTEEESTEYDFFNEQRLSDELDQALDAPTRGERAMPQYEEGAGAQGAIFDFESQSSYEEDPSEEVLRRADERAAAEEAPSEEYPRAAEPPSEEAPLDATVEQPRPNFDPPSEEAPQGPAQSAAEDEDEDDYDPATGHEDVLEDTPRFLEDAPEDDDLWFEQKPPKDFDLD